MKSKYEKGVPYHFIDFASGKSHYFDHVMGLIDDMSKHFSNVASIYPSMVHEVGCGEGLILSQIIQQLGWQCSGNDADVEAVRMGKILVPLAKIYYATDATEDRIITHDITLFSDSLEHIEKWQEHLEWAKNGSQCVIIAVPDRHDRHGLRDFEIGSFDATFSGWENPVRKTRAHRHLTIWRRPDA